MKKIRDSLIGFVLGIIICGVITMCFPEKQSVQEVRIDTITKIDTFIHPQYYKSLAVRTDTVMLSVVRDGETKIGTETVRVEVPIERKIYTDSSYYAVVSGYKPNLDSIMVRNKYIKETRTEYVNLKKRWGLGIQCGGGFTSQGFSPYIGIGVQYNFFSF